MKPDNDQTDSEKGGFKSVPFCFCALMSIVTLSSTPLCAADTEQQGKPGVQATAKQDEALVGARRARMSEISSVKKSGGAAGVNSLKRLLADKDPLVRGEAAAALGGVKDPSAFGALSDALKSGDANTRWGAIQGLSELKDKRAAALLTAALGHADRNTRWKAVKALGELKDAGAVDALIKVARKDKDKNVRLSAIEGLINIGGDKAAAAVAGFKNDPDPEVKIWAKAAADRFQQGKKAAAPVRKQSGNVKR